MVLSQLDLEEVARVAAAWDGTSVGGPEHRDGIDDAVAMSYRLANLSPPRKIIWCGGPADLAEQFARADWGLAAGNPVRASLVDDAREAASQVAHRHVDAVDRSRIQSRLALVGGENLRRSISTEVAAGVRRIVAGQHARQLGWRRLLPWVRRSGVARDLSDVSVSRYAASWLAIYQVLGELCGLQDVTARLAPLWRAVLGTGWIVPYENVCWIVPLPVDVQVDRHNRLHSPSGPALRFGDGWQIHAWKGVVVPENVIEDRAAIDGHAIARQADPVLRRCMLEIMTPERFIREGEATCVATDETGRLWRRRWPNGDVWAAVEVLNGTPEPDGSIKHYYLQVPPGVRTAREAVAWTYGLTELRYMALKVRT